MRCYLTDLSGRDCLAGNFYCSYTVRMDLFVLREISLNSTMTRMTLSDPDVDMEQPPISSRVKSMKTLNVGHFE